MLLLDLVYASGRLNSMSYRTVAFMSLMDIQAFGGTDF